MTYHVVNGRRLDTDDDFYFKKYCRAKGQKMKQSDLDPDKGFQFEETFEKDIKNKIFKAQHKTLGELANPRRAFETGCDKLFILDDETFETFNIEEKSLVKFAIEGKTFVGSEIKRMIFIPVGYTNKVRANIDPEEYMLEKLPNIYKYLKFKDIMTSGFSRSATSVGDYPWEVKNGISRVENTTHVIRRVAHNIEVYSNTEEYIPFTSLVCLTTTDFIADILNLPLMTAIHDLYIAQNSVGTWKLKSPTTLRVLPIPLKTLKRETTQSHPVTQDELSSDFGFTKEELEFLLDKGIVKQDNKD